MVLEGLDLQQIAAVVLDFGFVAGIVFVFLWTLAKSPIDAQLKFSGHINIGRDKPPEPPEIEQPAEIEQPVLVLEKKGA